MKKNTDRGLIVGLHHGASPDTLHVNLKWEGDHDISAFDLGSLGEVPHCKNESENTCMLRRAFDAESAGTGELGSVSESAAASTEEVYAPKRFRRFENYEVMLDEAGRPIELGRGAMGVTYKALDVDLRCPVTLKVISERYLGDESAQLRFLREARAAASVRHQNVASVLHLGRTGNSYFYAMEFVEGQTLESLIRRSGRLEVKLALAIATQVAAGLAAVHKQKLVHRDIKPSKSWLAWRTQAL